LAEAIVDDVKILQNSWQAATNENDLIKQAASESKEQSHERRLACFALSKISNASARLIDIEGISKDNAPL
jgi:hypothetical protein